MTSPLHSLSSHVVRRWKHIDPPGLWSSVFAGSAIVHLLILGFASRISIEPTTENRDLVAVDLVTLPLDNVSPAPTPTEPTIQPTIPTQPTTPNPPQNPTTQNPTTQNPTTQNPTTPFPSRNFPSASPTPPVEQPTPISPTPSIAENPIDSSTPPEEQPAEQPVEQPIEQPVEPSPTPTPDPTPEEDLAPVQENPNPGTPTPNPTTPVPSPEATEPTEPNQPSDTNSGDSSGDSAGNSAGNSAGDSPEATTTDSVRVTLASVTGVTAYEGSCGFSANGNFTVCPGNSIVSAAPDGQCNGQFSIEALIDDSVSISRGTILQFNGVRRGNGENALASCSIWLENLIGDWRFQPDENSEYFTSAIVNISIAIDTP